MRSLLVGVVSPVSSWLGDHVAESSFNFWRCSWECENSSLWQNAYWTVLTGNFLVCLRPISVCLLHHLLFPLFSDIPSHTTILEHDTDVGLAQAIKQQPYCLNQRKKNLSKKKKKEVEYLLAHDLAEPSFTACCLPCLLVNKSDGGHRFCTDYMKFNLFTKQECYALSWRDDRVGSATYASMFVKLKGFWLVPLTAQEKKNC